MSTLQRDAGYGIGQWQQGEGFGMLFAGDTQAFASVQEAAGLFFIGEDDGNLGAAGAEDCAVGVVKAAAKGTGEQERGLAVCSFAGCAQGELGIGVIFFALELVDGTPCFLAQSQLSGWALSPSPMSRWGTMLAARQASRPWSMAQTGRLRPICCSQDVAGALPPSTSSRRFAGRAKLVWMVHGGRYRLFAVCLVRGSVISCLFYCYGCMCYNMYIERAQRKICGG